VHQERGGVIYDTNKKVTENSVTFLFDPKMAGHRDHPVGQVSRLAAGMRVAQQAGLAVEPLAQMLMLPQWLCYDLHPYYPEVAYYLPKSR
jgi:hypothetical protein